MFVQRVSSPEIRKWLLLGSLYITQRLGLGFFFIALIAILRQQGVPLEHLSMIYMLGFFWIFKFLWAPLVDHVRFGRLGHYRGWLILMQSLMVVTLLLIALFDVQTQFLVIFALSMLVSLFSATQDIAADALACRLLTPQERGVGNGVQVAGGFIGNLIGGGFVLMAYSYIGWQGCMVILACGTAVPLLQILFFDEPEHAAAACTSQNLRVTFGAMWRFWRRPHMGRWLVLMLVYSLGIGAVYGIITPLLVDAGWSLDRIGFAVNVSGSLLGLAGALIAGWIIRMLGRRSALTGIAIAQTLGILAMLAPVAGFTDEGTVAFAVSLLLFLYSPGAVILSTIMMDKASSGSPATDFTLQYCVYMLASFIASGAGMAFSGAFGYIGVILVAVVIQILTAILAFILYTPDIQECEPELFADCGKNTHGNC